MEEIRVIKIKESDIQYSYPEGIWIRLDNEIYRLLGYDLTFGGSPNRQFNIENINTFEGQILRLEDNKILVKPYITPVIA
jgi:hypothetical protein